MTKDEALKLALKVFENIKNDPFKFDLKDDIDNAVPAIKEALANDTSQERVDKTSVNVHEPWSPVSIGVDITEEGAHVVGIYALDNDTSQVFYAKYYPVPQRTWVGLTDEEIEKMRHLIDWTAHWSYETFAKAIEAKLKEKNT